MYHHEDDVAAPAYHGLHEDLGNRLIGDECARAINELPPAFRMVMLLFLEDFTYEEIAAIADIPIGTVRSRLHRARLVLADKLRAYAAEHGYKEDDEPDMTASKATNDGVAS